MRRVALMLAASLLIPGTAMAQDIAVVHAGMWTIIPGSGRCVAFNRDPEEFDTTPYNGLFLNQDAEGVILAVHFWPGALDPGADEVILSLLSKPEDKISVVARADASYQVTTTEPLSPEQLGILAQSGVMTAVIDGTARHATFKMGDFGAALTALSDCLEAQ